MELTSENHQFLQKLGISFKTQSALRHWKKRTKQSRTRYLCLCELVSTEADYNRDLKLIHQKMQIPLQESKAISEEEEREMFPNIQGMINLSEQLFQDVDKLKTTWNASATLIGPTMVRYSKFLQIYSEFFKSYTNTLTKLKNMLERQDVRQIQNQLSPNTFDNLWSKPFQRPLKYKLLLSTYYKSLYKSHADYKNVELAIRCYEEVSQRNNKALENKEKSETLLSLEARFTGIIDNEAKYYIDEIQATMMDTKIKCHILSNMVLISNIEDNSETEIMRILFDQNSFVQPLKDIIYFKNRLYICGKRKSVHLSFKDKESRSRCEKEIQGIINELYKSQYTRKELSSQGRRSSYTRDSLQEVRRSYTQLPEILPKPPRFLVLNHIRRRYGCLRTFKIYFVIKFMLPFGQDNGQYLYIELQELLFLQTIMRNLYPHELRNIPALEQPSKTMNSPQMKINSVKSLEYKSIYATIFINYLFRHPQIVKRTDIIAHKLHINETMWLYCRYYNLQRCACHFCKEGEVLNSVESYNKELSQRLSNRTGKNTFFCPFRTIHAQNMFTQIDLSLINTAIDRLFFIRCEKGGLDYRTVDSTPGSIYRKKINIKMEKLESEKALELMIDPQQRVGQIIEFCAKIHKIRMEDYQMFLCVNKNSYLLGRDEVLWQVLDNETAVQENIFTFFKSAFGEKQDLTFHLFLRKVWVLQVNYQKANYLIEQQRLGFVIEEFMLRLKRQEIKLNIEDTSNFYACYYVYQRLGDMNRTIAEEELKSLIFPKKWKAMEIQQRSEMLEIVRLKIDKLRGKFTNAQILRNIWNYTMKMGQNCPGWSAFYFNASIIAHPQYDQGFQVKIGADLDKLYIKESEKMITILQYTLEQIQNLLIFSSWQLHILSPSYTYIFTGDSLFHLEEIINTYQLYRQMQKE